MAASAIKAIKLFSLVLSLSVTVIEVVEPTVASTYAFVAASCALDGSVTLVILELPTSTVPYPFGDIEILP